MSLTYVIPDIHGRFDLLSEALHGVHAHAAGNGGTLVMLGDYVDKGPDSDFAAMTTAEERSKEDGAAVLDAAEKLDAQPVLMVS